MLAPLLLEPLDEESVDGEELEPLVLDGEDVEGDELDDVSLEGELVLELELGELADESPEVPDEDDWANTAAGNASATAIAANLSLMRSP